ncbi:MAG: HEAT repeat domain-containing protein [Phycisphaerae bacterium]|nr:HEAT repeat domain-containing protein [Phycisphaerae bacterium]MDP7289599.1 HEAT repeat domain-containing protein [Phycisphaerae bacterium]
MTIAAAVLAVVVLWTWIGRAPSGGSDGYVAVQRRIEALAANDDQAALIAETRVKDEKAACMAVRAMGRLRLKFKAASASGVRAAMKDPRPAVRQAATIAISHAGNEKDTPVVSAVLIEDKSPSVRAAAALTLGRMRAYTEMETLLKALEDDNMDVRRRANAAIVKILGASGGFNASDSPARRQSSIAILRGMWSQMRVKTETFYKARKKRMEAAEKK